MKRLFVLLLLLASPVLAESRAWTDTSGKHHSTAELADFQGGVAYLRRDDGKIAPVPLTKLSDADQEFIKAAVPPVKVIQGKVVGITDGDTVKVVAGSTLTRIRLEGIDAPEGHQAYGTKSREALAAKVFQKNVRVEWRELDKYGRTLGHIFVGDRWVNKDMVQEGWAWHYRQYSKSEVLADAESGARTAKSGLWADASPIAPWNFRHPPTPAPLAATPKQTNQFESANNQAGSSSSKESGTTPVAPKTPTTVDRNPNGEESTGQTATGIPTYTGPRGGQYHYSQSGKKVYERRKR